MPKNIGQRKPLHWPIRVLMRAIRGSKFKGKPDINRVGPNSGTQHHKEDDDCRAEREIALQDLTEADHPIIVVDMTKTFGNTLM